jgi:hypothetical protein
MPLYSELVVENTQRNIKSTGVYLRCNYSCQKKVCYGTFLRLQREFCDLRPRRESRGERSAPYGWPLGCAGALPAGYPLCTRSETRGVSRALPEG